MLIAAVIKHLSIEGISKVLLEPTPAFPAPPERFAEASGHPSNGEELKVKSGNSL
jgi:hypothetical protein